MKRTEQQSILDALDHLALLNAHLERGTVDDLMVLDAVCLRLSAAIEVLATLTPERRQDLFGEQWHVMWAT